MLKGGELRARSAELSRGAAGCGDKASAAGINAYVATGSLCENGTGANVTLLAAPELQYSLYFSSSIFRALPMAPPPPARAAPAPSVRQRLLATLAPQAAAVSELLRSGALTVLLVPGDAVAAAASSSTATFDFIDTSNVGALRCARVTRARASASSF